tara:strand:+ start:119 stop:490 length:372 start_codon:yes stop_codon:yes gene_type:complete
MAATQPSHNASFFAIQGTLCEAQAESQETEAAMQQIQAEIKALQVKLAAQERRRAAAKKKLQEAGEAMEALRPQLRCKTRFSGAWKWGVLKAVAAGGRVRRCQWSCAAACLRGSARARGTEAH